MRRHAIGLAALLAITRLLLSPDAAEAQYTVIPEGPGLRGHVWLGDGVAGVFSSNKSLANRFRLGVEGQFGDEFQYILGMTFFDRISSGEKSTSVGGISRRSLDFNFGYFIVPDKLWAEYTLALQDVSGTEVIGSVTTVGHQASIGYRFYSHDMFNMAVEAAYLFAPAYAATTYNYATNVTSTANFPPANIWSLNLRLGFDIGGH